MRSTAGRFTLHTPHEPPPEPPARPPHELTLATGELSLQVYDGEGCVWLKLTVALPRQQSPPDASGLRLMN